MPMMHNRRPMQGGGNGSAGQGSGGNRNNSNNNNNRRGGRGRGGRGHFERRDFQNGNPSQNDGGNMLMRQVKGPMERMGAIEIAGKPATVLGRDVQLGMFAPEFVVNAIDWSAVDFLTATAGKVRIIAAVPSLDTSVCDMETRKFNQAAADLSDDVEVAIISTDMPMTQKRWCGNAGVDRVRTFSDVLSTDFGVKYGCLIKERRYLRRAVFVVDRGDKLCYVAYMSKLGDEPNYDEVLKAARAALN